jgi:hypothetical protein
MKTMQSGMLALLLLCGFISCQKDITTENLSPVKVKPQATTFTQTLTQGIEGDCTECVPDFAATEETSAANAVLTLTDGKIPVLTTSKNIKTVQATAEIFPFENVNVTVSHDAENIYFTLDRTGTDLTFGNFRFHSPALETLPTTGPGNAEVPGGTKKIQVVSSRKSLGACSSISFAFSLKGGSGKKEDKEMTSPVLTYTLRAVCPPACTIKPGDYRTQSRGYWRNNDGQAFLTANASWVDFTIGDGTNKKQFTTPESVKTFLDDKSVANGKPGTLPNGGTYAAHVLSLAINLAADSQVDDYSAASGKLGNLVVAISEADIAAHPAWAQLTIWNGMSVNEIFTIAQKVLGGTETKYSPSHMNELLTAINEAYEDGTVDTGFLSCGK